MPNRILKDSICRSEKINSLSDWHFRLWACLIVYVDDYGRGDARPQIIKGMCFPLRERVTFKDIEKGLADLAGAGCVSLYTVDGKPYLYFPNWEQHQRVRTKVSKYPAPEDEEVMPPSAAYCGQLPQNVARIQNPESDPNPKSESNNKGSSARFIPPTIDDVRQYCKEKGYAISPEQFVDYYSSNGWKVGKNPMVDWRAAVRNWGRKEQHNGRNTDPSEEDETYGTWL